MARLRVPLAVLFVLVLQKSVLEDVALRDVRPDALLLLAVCAGLVAGPEAGALTGFGVGLVADLFVLAPLGLSALVFSVLGYAVGTLRTTLIREVWWLPMATALVACAAGVLMYGLIGAVVGQAHFVRPQLLTTAALVAVMNAVLALPVARLAGWAFREAAR